MKDESREIVSAESPAALRRRVEEWYARAAEQGLPEAVLEWDDTAVKRTESGFYELEVWARS